MRTFVQVATCGVRIPVHLAFVAKYRHFDFSGHLLTRCEEAMQVVCEASGAELVEVNGEKQWISAPTRGVAVLRFASPRG